jgi:hypothetical protein
VPSLPPTSTVHASLRWPWSPSASCSAFVGKAKVGEQHAPQ